MKTPPQEDSTPNPSAFGRFLNWLDEGTESGGAKYLEVRRRLVSYFDRKNCPQSDELADETLRRVARRLEEEGGAIVMPPLQYCYIVAKFVFLEHRRDAGSSPVSLDERVTDDPRSGGPALSALADGQPDAKEKRAQCLDSCLAKLTAENRQLICGYYWGELRAKIDHRRAIAARSGLTMNALSIKACRIRATLEVCVKECFAS